VILLPFTFGMEPVEAFALLLGMYAVTTTSDTIASVMLGIPGTAASQATILDGYPLAMKGEAQRAFGAAFTVSAFGGVFGALLLAASLPIILPIILAFGNPEIFALGILGLSMVGSLSGASVLKGLIVALLGILVSTMGYSDVLSIPRFWFGTDYLLDGLPLIPVVLGLFAIPEIMELAIKDVSISRVSRERVAGVSIFTGIRDAFRHWWLALRCATFGTYIGVLPGLGGTIVDWLAYGHAVQSAKDKSQFGKGDIRGVIAPEAANNAIKGGALIPTVAFGIPGSLGAAILMGALLIQGLKPGPSMLTTDAHVTFSMVWSIVIANIFAAALLMVWSNQLARIAFIRGHLVVPAVILFVFMGAWLGGAAIGDWITCASAGIVGFVMKRGGWPRPPIVLALVLGGILENALNINMLSYGGLGWFGRPVVMIIIALTLITLILSVSGLVRTKRGRGQPTAGEGAERNAVLSLPLAVGLVIMFIAAVVTALDWPREVSRLPLAAAIPGAILSFAVALRDHHDVRIAKKKSGKLAAVLTEASKDAVLARALTFFGYLAGMILAGLVAGQIVAIVTFVAIYLRRWGHYGWRVCLGYAAVGWAILYGFYDQVMHIFWLQPLLDDFYSKIFDISKTALGL
jgi:TctA family transporter